MEEKFGAVLAAGLAVFGLMFVLNQGGLDLNQQQEMDRQVFLDKNIGQVGKSNPDRRTIDFGSFTVGETRGDIQGYYNEKASISDSLFGGESIKFSYKAEQPLEGNITFEVLGRSGKGSVWVKANGKKVFEEPLISTSRPQVSIPQERIKRGENDFEIGVKRPGIFSSSSYTLEEVELRVNDRKFHDFEETFNLYGYELSDYIASPLSFSISDSIKTAPLRIYVNGEQIYSKQQVRVSAEEVKVTPQNSNIHPGANSITFETDQPAKYSIGSADLTVRYLGNVAQQEIVDYFEANEQFASREDTTEKISFDYQNLLPSPRPLRIELNDFNTTLTPDNTVNNITLPEDTINRHNQIRLNSNGTYKIDSLKVISEKQEE
ncbi:MAG: hypothetical protein H8Z69_02865 [Nanohaloarchaea archaeon]|nr:hypothetical protein [Candidatus Nanohaloarchaea archaeon]